MRLTIKGIEYTVQPTVMLTATPVPKSSETKTRDLSGLETQLELPLFTDSGSGETKDG